MGPRELATFGVVWVGRDAEAELEVQIWRYRLMLRDGQATWTTAMTMIPMEVVVALVGTTGGARMKLTSQGAM